MKILAALKKIKHLDRKIEKTIKRIGKWCSYVVDNDNDPDPPYLEDDLSKMRQQIYDWTSEKLRIRHALHVTNVRTVVDYNGKKRSIDELLLLQNVVLPDQLKTFTVMRRKEKGGFGAASSKDSYVELQYDPRDRDMAVEGIENQLAQLDELLDDLNIETDVVGLD